MSKTTTFDNCKTLADLLKTLKSVAVMFPVPGGAYQILVQSKNDFLAALQDPKFGFDQLPEWVQQDYFDFPEILDQLVRLKELDLEMIGSWLWVSGYTWKYKDQLKELGLQFAPDKKLWYWRPADERSGNSHPMPIDLIRDLHGSDTVTKPFVFDQPEQEEMQPEPVRMNNLKPKRYDHQKRTPVRSFQRS